MNPTRQLLPGLDQLPGSFLQGKGYVGSLKVIFVLSDVAAAVLYKNVKNATQYANNTKQVNLLRAPSLKYIDSGHPNVSLLF